MTKDPRSHRRYKDAARAWIASLPSPVTCLLCGQPCNTTLPGTHPLGPTVEHQPPVRWIVANTRDYREAVAWVANPSTWAGVAHRRCQARQGQRATTAINRARNAGRAADGASRRW